MGGMIWGGGRNKGITRLSPDRYVELVVRILGNRHGSDVIERMVSYLGERASRMGPVDLGRNVLRSWCDRVCRAYSPPPLVSGLPPGLAAAMGDVSASVTIARYAAAGGYPMPTPMVQASALAQRFEQAAGYSGTLIGWSTRTGRIYLDVIPPDDLQLFYAGDDPTEPTVIRQRGVREVEARPREVVEVYDLTDLDNPSYRVLLDGKDDQDVTQQVHGRTFEGDDYLWRHEDGRPWHRIVVRGHPSRLYDRLQQVEAALVVPIRWTAWGSGCDFASHPGRNVRGLHLAGMASDTDERGTGLADGPEVIKRWADTDPDRPGDHWQDAPAYDPLMLARAVGFYETLTLSLIDLPLQLEATGGEPTAREAEALEERISSTLAECRRADGELLRRCAALANALDEVEGEGFPEAPYASLYRGEISQALEAAASQAAPALGGGFQTPDPEAPDA